MDHLHIIHITSLEDLRNNATAWDDLWWQSDVAMPLARAESLAQWVEHFRPRADFHALVVARSGRWIAALPLVSYRVGWLIPSGEQPGNAWSPCGELLCDATVETDATMDMLLAAAAQLPWQLLWLNDAVPETPRWQALLRACERVDIATDYHERYRVGRVEIGGSWELFRKRLPKNHRQGMCRATRRLECEGEVRFEMNSKLDPSEIKPWLDEAFEVENLGWKGAGGSSVLSTPGMFRFFVGQAEQLARWSQLETAALRLDGRMLAFVYGFRAKGVYFAHKIGYDPGFAAFSPGQLLFHHILEQLHNDGQTGALDFVGPLSQSHSRWRPATYGVGRVALAPRRLLGRVAMYTYRHVWRRLRQGQDAAALAEPMAPVPSRAAPPAVDSPVVLEPAGT
ncbi:MAG: GNAT family N-acetyltransferase [Pirellulales bacterium]|nr:GNAT family N-acetyltransferase [Pirellulales bacterium]